MKWLRLKRANDWTSFKSNVFYQRCEELLTNHGNLSTSPLQNQITCCCVNFKGMSEMLSLFNQSRVFQKDSLSLQIK